MEGKKVVATALAAAIAVSVSPVNAMRMLLLKKYLKLIQALQYRGLDSIMIKYHIIQLYAMA